MNRTDRTEVYAMARDALRRRRQEKIRLGPVLDNLLRQAEVKFSHRFILAFLIVWCVLVIVVMLPEIANAVSPDWKSGPVLRPTPLFQMIGLTSVALVIASAVGFYLSLSGCFDDLIRRFIVAIRSTSGVHPKE